MQEKELKLMKVLYLIKERGINIEDILNEVIDMNNEENLMGTNRTNNSDFTVYFNDKVHMKNIMDTKEAKKVPLMDFNKVPTYRPDSDSDYEKLGRKFDSCFEREIAINGDPFYDKYK